MAAITVQLKCERLSRVQSGFDNSGNPVFSGYKALLVGPAGRINVETADEKQFVVGQQYSVNIGG